MGLFVQKVICASLISGIALCLVQGAAAKKAVKLICGAFLGCCILSGLTRLDFDRALWSFDSRVGEDMASYGEDLARQAWEKSIKQQCEAYVMDKAASFGSTLTVDISLRSGIPEGAVLGGNVSPYGKGQIEEILQKDLGIPKENVKWTG